jgi:hypothetical protein
MASIQATFGNLQLSDAADAYDPRGGPISIQTSHQGPPRMVAIKNSLPGGHNLHRTKTIQRLVLFNPTLFGKNHHGVWGVRR